MTGPPEESSEQLQSELEAVDPTAEPERAIEICEEIAERYEDGSKGPDADVYATALQAAAVADAEQEDLDAIADRVESLRQLHRSVRTEATATPLADALVTEARSHQQLIGGTPGEVHSNLQFVDALAGEYPGEALASRLAAALCWAAHASYDRGDYKDTRRKADRIGGLYKQYPTDEIAYWLADGAHPKSWVDCRHDDYDAHEAEIERVEGLLERHDHEKLPGRLAHHLRNASLTRLDNDNERGGLRHFDRIEAFYEEHADDFGVAYQYGRALRRLVEHYLDASDRTTAASYLDRLSEIYERHADDNPDVASPYAKGLSALISDSDEGSEDPAIRDRLDRLRDLAVEHPSQAGGEFVDAIEPRVEVALSEGDVERASDLIDGLDAVEGGAPLQRAELHTRVALERGDWGLDADRVDVTVLDRSDDEVTVSVVDAHGVEHQVRVEPGGFAKTLTGRGSIPPDWDDLTPLQQILSRFMRGYAAQWVEDNESLAVLDPYERIENIETVRSVVDECSVETISEHFEPYIDQHASHFADGTPFVDTVDRPVDPAGINLDAEDVLYELFIAVRDGTVVATSDVQVTIVEDRERDVVVEADAPDAGDAVARLSLRPRPLFDPEAAQDVLVDHLGAVLRDRHLSYGMSPPEHARLLGPGRQALRSIYERHDVLPNFHDPTASVPGYEQTRTDRELQSDQLGGKIEQQFVDRNRRVVDAYRDAPIADRDAPATTNPT